MHKQGRPDGPNEVCQVHILKPRTQRDRELGNEVAQCLCNNGGFHQWFASRTEEVTCPKCKELAQKAE